MLYVSFSNAATQKVVFVAFQHVGKNCVLLTAGIKYLGGATDRSCKAVFRNAVPPDAAISDDSGKQINSMIPDLVTFTKHFSCNETPLRGADHLVDVKILGHLRKRSGIPPIKSKYLLPLIRSPPRHSTPRHRIERRRPVRKHPFQIWNWRSRSRSGCRRSWGGFFGPG